MKTHKIRSGGRTATQQNRAANGYVVSDTRYVDQRITLYLMPWDAREIARNLLEEADIAESQRKTFNQLPPQPQ